MGQGILNRGTKVHKSKKVYSRLRVAKHSNCERRSMKCSHCHKDKSSVEERYSFGVYAGIFCRECCKRYRDHCGIDQDQGRASDLDEPYWED